MSNIRYDKISTYFYLFKKSFILATISGVLYNSLMAFIPLVQGKLINLYCESSNNKYLIEFSLLFIFLVLFVMLNRYLKRYYVRDFSNRMVLKLREKSFENFLLTDIESFTDSKGEILTKLMQDIKDSAEGVRKILTEVYDSILLLTCYFISLFIMDYKLTFIVLLFCIISILCANFMKKIISKNVKEYKKSVAQNKDLTLTLLNNELNYRGIGVSDRYYAIYDKSQNDLEKKSIKAILFKSSFEPIYQTIALIGLVFVVYFAGKNVILGTWKIGTFSSYLSTFMLVATKASKTGKAFNAAATLKVSWVRCKPYLCENFVQKNIEIKSDEGLIVKDLTFGFDDNFSVNNITFDLKKGVFLGICGAVHSGKSTLGASLSGIYDYLGSIKLSGLELKDIRKDNIKNFISYIPSNSSLFSDSINFNVSFNNVDVMPYLKDVYLDKEIDINNNISHSCPNLSGGQIKRLEIARAISNNSVLTILDDPFNALDIKMSEDILINLKERLKDNIVIIINNQKEILSKLDKILYLKDGKYILSTYNDLLEDESFRKLMGLDYGI